MSTIAPGIGTEAAPILQLGDAGLRERSRPVSDVGAAEFRVQCARLHATLRAFRDEFGFGRAISAPQIGVRRRFIALDLADDPFTMINPQVTWASAETFTLWDDCLSFPDLLVRLRRHCSVSVRFLDERGNERKLERLDRATSELFQHEIDHLDGILAVDRALDRDSVVSRAAFERRRAYYSRQVDYQGA